MKVSLGELPEPLRKIARNETGDLALAFDGRLYSDQSIDALADDILRVVHPGAATHDITTK